MRPERILAAGLLCEALAALFLVRAFKRELDVPVPPLARIPPEIAEPGARRAEHAVLVIADGLGAREASGLPGLAELEPLGARGTAKAFIPTLSRPGYAAILSGVRPGLSGVRTNLFSTPVAIDTLPARVAAAGGSSSLVTHFRASFSAMFAPHLHDEVSATELEQLPALAAAPLPAGLALRVVMFPDVDQMGHDEGAASPEYASAARHVDGAILGIARALDPARELLVVVSDHGHIAAGGHGGAEPEVTLVPLLFVGPGVRSGAVIQDATLEDVAPTVATLLGLPAPGHALGHTLLDVLDADAAAAARIRATDEGRRAALERGLAAPLEAAARGDRTRRLLRGLASLLAIAAAAALRRRLATRAASGFVRALLGWMLLALAGVAVLRFDLSPSRLPPGYSLAGLALLVGLPSLLATTFVLRGLSAPDDRNALRSASLLLGAAGLGIAWTLCCPPFTTAPAPPGAVVGGPILLLASGGAALATFFATPTRPRERRRRSR